MKTQIFSHVIPSTLQTVKKLSVAFMLILFLLLMIKGNAAIAQSGQLLVMNRNESTSELTMQPNGFNPLELEKESAGKEFSIEYSNDGYYYVLRGVDDPGPNFGVNYCGQFLLPRQIIISIPNRAGDYPGKLNTIEAKFNEVLNVFKPEFYNQLNFLDKQELYWLSKSRRGFYMYDEYIEDWKYKTMIRTKTWKMVIKYNRNGEIIKIRKKSRGKQTAESLNKILSLKFNDPGPE